MEYFGDLLEVTKLGKTVKSYLQDKDRDSNKCIWYDAGQPVKSVIYMVRKPGSTKKENSNSSMIQREMCQLEDDPIAN